MTNSVDKVLRLVKQSEQYYKQGNYKAAIIRLNEARQYATTAEEYSAINTVQFSIANTQYQIKTAD